MQKVFITGGAGQIGKHLIKHFLSKKFEVYAHIHNTQIKGIHKSHIIKCNFSKLDEVRNLEVPKIDVLINNAALFRLDRDIQIPQELININALAPVVLAKKCIDVNKSTKIINILDSWILQELPERYMYYTISKKLLHQYTEMLGFFGLSIGATLMKKSQKQSVFDDVAQKYSSTVDDILESIDYILDDGIKKGEILDIADAKSKIS